MAEKPATSSAEGGQVAPAQHLQALREEFTKVPYHKQPTEDCMMTIATHPAPHPSPYALRAQGYKTLLEVKVHHHRTQLPQKQGGLRGVGPEYGDKSDKLCFPILTYSNHFCVTTGMFHAILNGPSTALSGCKEVNNTLQQEAKQLREADHKLRSELTTLRAQLDFEKSAKHDEEMRGTQLAARLEEQKARYATLDKRFVGAEETLRREEAAGREAEANLKLVSREKSQRELDLKVATSRAQELEEKCSKLLAERAAHSQLQIELQASLAAQRDAYKAMHRTESHTLKARSVCLCVWVAL
eukprot:1298973-Amphidinium_carterae.2